jgi:hypothetical protein
MKQTVTILVLSDAQTRFVGFHVASPNNTEIHDKDPDMILQACEFEIVSREVEKLPVPDWAFDALNLSPEERNFRYEAMLYPNGRAHNHWRPGSSIPDISQPETKLWFYIPGRFVHRRRLRSHSLRASRDHGRKRSRSSALVGRATKGQGIRQGSRSSSLGIV